ETFRSERLRLRIVAVLLGIGLVRWVVAWIPLTLEGGRWAPAQSGLWAVTVVGGLAFAYEMYVVSVVGRVMRLGGRIARGRRYRNALVETTVPTLMLVIGVAVNCPPDLYVVPVAWSYFLFIILSTLHLDFRLCAF